MTERRPVFVTGGTGYLGQALILQLLRRGYPVKALARAGSETRVPAGAEIVRGDALRAESFADAIAPADTVVPLVGTPRPNPAKGAEFRAVDLESIRAAVAAATGRVRHLVYVSVAHPAPVMRDYIAVRRQGEEMVRASGLDATILRPWYVLGPGHRWPMALVPMYAVLRRVPATRAGAERLGLITRDQMVAAMLHAIANPPTGIRVLEVPEIRGLSA
jgi:uncharacterized protein YbjT (DUF2867 family)